MFSRSDNFNKLAGSSLKRRVTISPTTLVYLFGEPSGSDGYKVSMEWVFENSYGDVVSIYDWKSTSLYGYDYPSPQTLRTSNNPYEFHVGGHCQDAADDFVTWLYALEIKDVG